VNLTVFRETSRRPSCESRPRVTMDAMGSFIYRQPCRVFFLFLKDPGMAEGVQ
jgi:hypothetical protein